MAKAAELMTTHQAGKMRGRRGRQAATGSLTKSWDAIFCQEEEESEKSNLRDENRVSGNYGKQGQRREKLTSETIPHKNKDKGSRKENEF